MGKFIKSTQMAVNWLLKYYASFTSINLTFDHYWTCNDRQFTAFTKISVKMGKNYQIYKDDCKLVTEILC